MSTRALTNRQRRFVEKARIATLASLRADGSPHTSPVWYRYEDGVFKVLIDRGSQKHRNIERDPRVELCIDDRERPPFHTVIVRGRAELREPPGAAWRRALAVHYLGEDGGKRYVESTPSGDAVLVVLAPERVTGW